MCVKLLIERHIECAQSSRESKGKLIRLIDCKLRDLGVMLSLFVELWFKFLDVGLFQSMSLCRIFNIEERRAEKEWFSKFTVFSNYAMFEMFVTIQHKVFSCRFRTSFLWLFILARQFSVLPTYCFEHAGHVSRYSMNLLLQWNLLFSLNKVAPVGDLASVSLLR